MDYSLMELELTNDKHLEEVEKLASNYLLQSKTLQQLQKIEVDLFKNEDPSLFKKLAIKLARSKKIMPSVIIADTIKGKGVSYMEDVCGWHGKAPDEDQYRKAMAELKGGK